jgi:hypothetical protein
MHVFCTQTCAHISSGSFGALKLTYEEIVQKGTGFRIRPG